MSAFSAPQQWKRNFEILMNTEMAKSFAPIFLFQYAQAEHLLFISKKVN